MKSVVEQELDAVKEILAARSSRHADRDEDLPAGTSGHNFRKEADDARVAEERASRGVGLTWFHIVRASFWAAMSETRSDKLRGALVRLAADVIAWIECIDRQAQREADNQT